MAQDCRAAAMDDADRRATAFDGQEHPSSLPSTATAQPTFPAAAVGERTPQTPVEEQLDALGLQLLSQDVKADGQPRRPMNAFLIYARWRRMQLMNEESSVAGIRSGQAVPQSLNRAMKPSDISAALGAEWGKLSYEAQWPFHKKAQQLRAMFDAANPGYKFSRGPKGATKLRRQEARRLREESLREQQQHHHHLTETHHHSVHRPFMNSPTIIPAHSASVSPTSATWQDVTVQDPTAATSHRASLPEPLSLATMIHAVESSSVRSPSAYVSGSAISAMYKGGHRQSFVPVVPSQSPNRMDVSYSSDVGRDQRLRHHEELPQPSERESVIPQQYQRIHTHRHEGSQGASSSSQALSPSGCSSLNHPITGKSSKRSPGTEQDNILHSKGFGDGQALEGSYTIPTFASSRTGVQPGQRLKAPQRLSLDLNGPVLLHKTDSPLWSASISAKQPGENLSAYTTSFTGRPRGQTLTANFPSQLDASHLWSSHTRVHHSESTRDVSFGSASISRLPSNSCLDPRRCRGVADATPASSPPPPLMRPRAITEVVGRSAHSMGKLAAPVRLTAPTDDWLHGSPSAASAERVLRSNKTQTDADINKSEYNKVAAEGRSNDDNHNDDVALRHPTSKALSLLPPPSIDAARWLIKGDDESSKGAQGGEGNRSAEMSEDSNGSNNSTGGDRTLGQ